MRRFVSLASLLAATVLVSSAAAHAEDKPWEQPKDGVFTEKQVDTWIEYTTRYLKKVREVSKYLEAHKDDTKAIGQATLELEQYGPTLLKELNLQKAELEWIGKEAYEIHSVVWLWSSKVKPELDERVKEANEKVASGEKAKTEIAAAKKAGRRYMTPEEKAQAKASAEEQVKAAEEALKEARAATAEAQKALDESRAALKKASAEEKADLEQQEKDREEALRTVKENEAEPAKNLELAKKRQKDPDLPANAEEKAEVDTYNDDRDRANNEELASAKTTRDILTKTAKDYEETAVTGELKKHPAKNVEIVRARTAKIQANIEGALTGAEPRKEEKK